MWFRLNIDGTWYKIKINEKMIMCKYILLY